MSSDPLLVYGVTGHTGRLIVREAVARGLRPIVAGRDENAVASVASDYGLQFAVAELYDGRLEALLAEVDAVLHVAGPFSATALPMAQACIRTATHYLDVAGELPVFEHLYDLRDSATAAGVMLMPGVGFAVVPSDCLAAHVASRAGDDVDTVRIGFSRGDLISRGSATTMVEMINSAVRVTRRGRIESVPVGRLHRGFDFGDGLVDCTAMSWPDVFTAFLTTGARNVETFTEATAVEELAYVSGAKLAPFLRSRPLQSLLKFQTRHLPRWPGGTETAGVPRVILVEVENRWRQVWRSRLSTPDGYRFTGDCAVAVAERVLNGEFRVGFATPASVLGADFVLGCDAVVREDLD